MSISISSINHTVSPIYNQASTSASSSDNDSLISAIEQRFSQIQITPRFEASPNSAFQRRVALVKTDYFFGSCKLSLCNIIERILANKTDPLQLLDLGTGNGQVPAALMQKFGQRVEAYGLDAQEPVMLESRYRLIGDIERLPSPDVDYRRWDVIVSQGVFDELIDPASAISRAYSLLKKDGFLIIDRFSLQRMGYFGLAIVDFIKSSGYQIATEVKNGLGYCSFNAFIVKKTQDHFHWPFYRYHTIHDFGYRASYFSSYDLSTMLQTRKVIRLAALNDQVDILLNSLSASKQVVVDLNLK